MHMSALRPSASVSVRIPISAVAEKKVHVEYVCVCVCVVGGGGSSWDSRAIKPVCYLVGEERNKAKCQRQMASVTAT